MIGMMLLMVMTVSQSCTQVGSRDTDHILTVAEELMESSPDSVLALLSDPALRPGTDRQKALYALLLTQARHKNYIDETNDSLIATAVDYFDRKGDGQRLMKPLSYHATINSNASNYPAAMTSAMQAKQLAEKNEDIYWQARIAELTGHLFSNNFLYDEAAITYGKAAHFYKIAGWEHPHLYSLLDMAREIYNQGDSHGAFAIADSIRKITSDTFLLQQSYSIAFDAMRRMNNQMKANEFADSLLKIGKGAEIGSFDYCSIAKIKYELNDDAEAEKLLQVGGKYLDNARDSLVYNSAMLLKFKKEGNIDSAYQTLRDILRLQNDVALGIRKQSVIRAQRDYFSLERLKAAQIAEKRKIYLSFGIVVAIFLMVTSFIYYRYKLLRKKAIIDEQLTYIFSLSERERSATDERRGLSEKLSVQGDENNRMHQLVQKLLADNLSRINYLLNNYYNSTDSSKSQLVFYKNMEKEIKRLTNQSNISEIEDLINQSNNNIVMKIREQLPELSNENIIFLTLVIAGYEPRAISLFTGIGPNSTYSKRRRLINRIAASSAMDKEWFISQIENPIIGHS